MKNKILVLVWAAQYEGEKFLGLYPETSSLLEAVKGLDYDLENLFFYEVELGADPLGLCDHETQKVSDLVG